MQGVPHTPTIPTPKSVLDTGPIWGAQMPPNHLKPKAIN